MRGLKQIGDSVEVLTVAVAILRDINSVAKDKADTVLYLVSV